MGIRLGGAIAFVTNANELLEKKMLGRVKKENKIVVKLYKSASYNYIGGRCHYIGDVWGDSNSLHRPWEI